MPKVLVVDDSLSVRKVVERALEARSIQVLTAATGAEAITRIERDAPDLVICDVIMPDKDGYEICEFVKNHPDFSRTPVLLISGIVNGTVLERAAKVHSDDVMRKPFAAEELVRKIDNFLAPGGRPPAPLLRAATGRTGRTDPAAPSLSSLTGLPTRAQDPVPETSASPVALDLKAVLGQFTGVAGVVVAALVDREGFLIESTGEVRDEVHVAWAQAAAVAQGAAGTGQDLNQGVLQAMILEYEGGNILLHTVGSAMLAIVLNDPTILGKVRYNVKRALPDLLRSM
jgi:CheY-like chemotaxis protein